MAEEMLDLVDSLAQLSFALQTTLTRVAERLDLSLVLMRLLGILRDREPSMLELSAYLTIDKSSVTGLVTRAEKRGLVQRKTTPEDRRAVHVALTTKGRELAGLLTKLVEREIGTLTDPLSATEKTRLTALASRIVADEKERRFSEGARPPARNATEDAEHARRRPRNPASRNRGHRARS